MDDAVAAHRLEQLLLYNDKAKRPLNHTFSKLKLNKKGEKRLA